MHESLNHDVRLKPIKEINSIIWFHEITQWAHWWRLIPDQTKHTNNTLPGIVENTAPFELWSLNILQVLLMNEGNAVII